MPRTPRHIILYKQIQNTGSEKKNERRSSRAPSEGVRPGKLLSALLGFGFEGCQ